ncbi:MAG: pre-peptidase C-terminal domain-containing protein [Planctomycetota bacterium]
MKREAVLSACAIVAFAAGANAAIINESEPNDTIATANAVGSIDDPGGAIVIDGALTSGDVDWFSLELLDMTTLFVSSLASADFSADGQMMVVDSSGTNVIAFDDDSFVGLQPGIVLADLPAGTYYVGISGFPDITFFDDPVGDDILFDGLDDSGAPHPEEFEYKLTISANLIPTPGTVALAGLGGLAMVRRRRA